MEWLTVGTITTSENYSFTPVVNGTLFKLKHISQSTAKNSLKIAVRQAIDDDGELALFDYKLINCKTEQDIISFSVPQGLTDRRLAIKRIDDLPDNWTIEIQTLISETTNMPSYPASPISSTPTNFVTDTSIALNILESVMLSAAHPRKVGTMITNKSIAKLYISMNQGANYETYDKILGTNEVFETPFNYSGAVFGIWDVSDSYEPNDHARVRDFSQIVINQSNAQA